MARRLGACRALGAAMCAAALAAVQAVAGCSSEDGDSPSSGDVPEGAVATVGDVEVSREQLDERVAQLARAQRGRPAPGGGSAGARDGAGADAQPGGSGGDPASGQPDGTGELEPAQREQLEAQALSTLLMEEAIEQEAADRGIEVADAEVRRRWRAVSDQQFRNRRQLRRFLGGQTVDDVMRQLRLQELTQRIHDQVREQADGNPDRAVERFQREFHERWAERTACTERLAAAGCGDDGG